MVAAPRVAVLGGTGRVGGSAARWALELGRAEGVAPGEVLLCGRGPERFPAAKARVEAALPPGLRGRLAFEACDAEDAAAVQRLAEGCDLVINAAGPFQGRRDPAALRGAIAAGCSYMDVCDETPLVAAGQALSAEAEARGVAAVTSGGIWPGVSALMAAEADEHVGGAEDIELSFYTAGTGDSGAAIVAATFLLLQEEPSIYAGGERAKRRDAGGAAAALPLRPWDDPRVVDFGGPLPREGTTVWTLDNPETETVHRALGTPNISSRFATAPQIWNLLFLATRLLVPARLLANRGFAMGIAKFSMPVIRFVDKLVGSRNAMHCRAVGKDGTECAIRVQHSRLEVSTCGRRAGRGGGLTDNRAASGWALPHSAWNSSRTPSRPGCTRPWR